MQRDAICHYYESKTDTALWYYEQDIKTVRKRASVAQSWQNKLHYRNFESDPPQSNINIPVINTGSESNSTSALEQEIGSNTNRFKGLLNRTTKASNFLLKEALDGCKERNCPNRFWNRITSFKWWTKVGRWMASKGYEWCEGKEWDK